ncbi:MAG: peptide ABC transporter substrate-binding protein [Synergistaceae bacterium]|nr:peptide ABC transporter substrate-binding protein [Synergistaceae bacterium]
MRKILMAVLAFAVMASAASAGTNEIVYNLGADPRTIDPALNNALDGANVDVNIFEGLLRTSTSGLPEPGCAESWYISDDGMTWTFHLRENLKWSDGQPLTASHFRDGFLRALDPETGSPYAYYAFFIKNGEAFYNSKASRDEVGLSAPDNKTLVINLEYQNPLMLDYMSFQLFAPARMDIVSENPRAWAARPETLISNGPFMLESWKHGDGGEMTLVKNPHYWDADSVKAERLHFVFINDPNTAYAAFRAGRIDYMGDPPSQMTPMLIKTGQAKVLPALGTAFCDFNMKRKPFDDVRVRRAFTLAIDRRIIVDKITMSGQVPAGGLVCGGIPGTTDAQDFRTEGGSFLPERANVEEARRLLAEAGYPNGEGFPKVSYKYNSNAGNKQMAEALQGMWKQVLGVEVELLNEEWKVFIETRNRMDYDIARDAWIMDFVDAMSILEQFISTSPQNKTGYNNPKFDEAMRNAAYEMDHVKRINYLHEAEKLLMEDLPAAPIYFYTSLEMMSKRVRNIYKTSLGWIIFRNAEIVH